MKFRHLHSIKEVPYGLFTLHVQLDFTIGVKDKNDFKYKSVILLTMRSILLECGVGRVAKRRFHVYNVLSVART